MVIQYKDIGSIFCPEAAPESDIHTSYYKTFLPSKSLKELAEWMLRKWQKEIASGIVTMFCFGTRYQVHFLKRKFPPTHLISLKQQDWQIYAVDFPPVFLLNELFLPKLEESVAERSCFGGI